MVKIACIVLFLIGLSTQVSTAQTCCSGGVPISSNIGFNSDEQKTLQLTFTSDFNVLESLYSDGERLDDQQRQRTTQSYLVRAGYSLSNKISIETSFSVVRQTRKIYGLNNNVDFQSTLGLGDPVILFIYDITDGPLSWRAGAGPQIPLGRTNLRSDRGLFLVEDLQPGSGAWDAIIFNSLSYSPVQRPTRAYFLNAIYSSTGVNEDSRDGLQSYEFGNDIQIIGGLSDQLLWVNQIFTPSVGLRYRRAARDLIDDIPNSGTGGSFLFLRAGLAWSLPNDIQLNLNGELPLHTRVNETQLATSYTLNVGVYKRFSFNDSNIIDIPNF